MIAHLKALQALTEPILPTFLHRAPQTAPAAYFIWMAPGWGLSDETSMCGDSNLDATVRLLCRAVTGDAVAIKLQLARGAVSSLSGMAASLTVPGRNAFVQYLRSEFVMPDLDVTLPESNTHPFYGVDSYRLISEAA